MIINIIDDTPKATEEEFNRRKSICEACSLYENGCCLDCNCLINRKALEAENTCPEGLW